MNELRNEINRNGGLKLLSNLKWLNGLASENLPCRRMETKFLARDGEEFLVR